MFVFFTTTKNSWPFFIGNLRFETDTGSSPFEIPIDLVRNLPAELNIDGTDIDVGQFTFGMNYASAKKNSANLAVAIGATRDAPDVQMTLRVPLGFDMLTRLFELALLLRLQLFDLYM